MASVLKKVSPHREEWGFLMRRWVKTSSSLAVSAESGMLSRFLPEATTSKVYIDMGPGYGVQYINTLVVPTSSTTSAQQQQGGGAPTTRETAVVLTHGFGGGSALFYHCLKDLRHKCDHLFAIDWLGMGLSSRPTSGLIRGRGYPQRPFFTRRGAEDVSDECVDFFVQSLELWREAMGIAKLQLVGHSLGGYLSAKYALKHPDRVDKLVLVSPVGVPDVPKDRKDAPEWVKRSPYFTSAIRALWSLNVTPQSVVRFAGPWGQDMIRRAIRRRFNRISHENQPRRLDDEDCDCLSDYLYHITVDRPSGEFALNALLMPVTHAEHAGIYARRPLAPNLADLKVPVTLIYGDRDWMFHPQVHDLVEEHSHKASLSFVRDAGHHVYFDNPKEFNAELTRVLGF